MQGFEPVTLGWDGDEFTVPAERQLRLVAEIEDALAGASGRQALDVLMQPNGPPIARLSQAYGAALRYAGALVTDDQVYLSIMEELAQSRTDTAVKIQTSIMGLLAIIAPPIARSLQEELTEPEKKPKRPKKG